MGNKKTMADVRALDNPAASACDAQMGWTAVYDRFVKQVQSYDVGHAVPSVGERFPDFRLPDTRGVYRTVEETAQGRPLVVSFNRGTWCYYCTHELRTWAAAMPALRKAGAQLLVVTGELGEGADLLGEMAGRDVTVLCDVDHGVALNCGLAFYIGEDIKTRYLAYDLDLTRIYGSDAGFLPIPATFVIDGEGIVRWSHVEADFRIRPDPHDVAKFVATLAD